jgi:leucine dehydrogenase
VINAGGLINVYSELKGYPREKAMQDSANIFNTVKRIINKARTESSTTIQASNRVAEERMEAVARVKRMYIPA